MKSIIAAVAALAASVVSAQSITSSQPTLNQVVTAGTTTQIVWAPVAGTISSIDLRKGDAAALILVANVASNVDASKGSYAWNVDASLPAGNDYALSFGQSPNVSYTPFFTIQAASGGAASSSAASSNAASSVASATSAAASGANSATSAAQSAAQSATSAAQSAASSATSAAHSAASSAHSAAHSAASSAASAAVSPNASSAGNKNIAAVGVAAVAGAVVAALI